MSDALQIWLGAVLLLVSGAGLLVRVRAGRTGWRRLSPRLWASRSVSLYASGLAILGLDLALRPNAAVGLALDGVGVALLLWAAVRDWQHRRLERA